MNMNTNVEKLSYTNKSTQLLSIFSFILSLVAVYMFGYGISMRERLVFKEDLHKIVDISISNAVGNGKHIFVSFFLVISMILNIYLINYRGGIFMDLRFYLVTLLYILTIIIVIINPFRKRIDSEKAKKYVYPHCICSTIAFSLLTIYIIITYYSLIKSSRSITKYMIMIFMLGILVQVIGYIGCIISKIIELDRKSKKKWEKCGKWSKAFAVFENVQILSFFISTLFIGSYCGN